MLAFKAGCWLVKLRPYIVGIPDRLLLGHQGRVVFIEFKRAGERPTRLQTIRHDALREIGHRVEVVRTVEEFREILASVR